MPETDLGMNMNDPYGIREIQLRLLAMLKDIDRFCRENDIRYSINGGTLLGAVRHKGFIPWDDDADIMLDRENYKKFVRTAEHRLPSEYEIIGDTWIRRITRKDNPAKENEEECIDLFVMDNIPENKFLSKMKNIVLKTLQGMLKKNIDYRQYSFRNKILVCMTHFLGCFFPTRTKQRWYESVSQWGNSESAGTSNIYNSLYRQIGLFVYSSDMIKEMTDIEFEDTKLMAVKDANQYLSVCYGNYMELPPEEKRIPMHKKEK